MTSVTTLSHRETVELGRALGSRLRPGDVVALSGNLGTGKTTLIKGICEALGVTTHVASPSFTMISEYHARDVVVVHIDLYRVRSNKEVAELGLEEYFNDRTICLVEWPEPVLDLLPQRYFEARLEYGASDEERHITIEERVVERGVQSLK
jgi:tRNA threonylcarbamoyladenosine biosynthesis protein TsaE